MIDTSLESVIAELIKYRNNHFFGKYRGLVEQVDPKLGRITAKVHGVYGDQESPWAWPAFPFAGKNHGMMVMPEKGDGVWVEFEAGNPDIPIWSGCWFAKDEVPKPLTEDVRGIVTSAGLQFILDEKNKELKLVHPGGAEISLTDKKITLTVGKKTIVFDSSGLNVLDNALVVK
jgi:uncharacterized protein involved in type VI secretion and phage assembly